MWCTLSMHVHVCMRIDVCMYVAALFDVDFVPFRNSALNVQTDPVRVTINPEVRMYEQHALIHYMHVQM